VQEAVPHTVQEAVQEAVRGIWSPPLTGEPDAAPVA